MFLRAPGEWSPFVVCRTGFVLRRAQRELHSTATLIANGSFPSPRLVDREFSASRSSKPIGADSSPGAHSCRRVVGVFNPRATRCVVRSSLRKRHPSVAALRCCHRTSRRCRARCSRSPRWNRATRNSRRWSIDAAADRRRRAAGGIPRSRAARAVALAQRRFGRARAGGALPYNR